MTYLGIVQSDREKQLNAIFLKTGRGQHYPGQRVYRWVHKDRNKYSNARLRAIRKDRDYD